MDIFFNIPWNIDYITARMKSMEQISEGRKKWFTGNPLDAINEEGHVLQIDVQRPVHDPNKGQL
jgi:hypothetical protein